MVGISTDLKTVVVLPVYCPNLGTEPLQNSFPLVWIAERFQKALEAPFFCPVPNMIRAPSNEGALIVSATPPIGKAPEVSIWRV